MSDQTIIQDVDCSCGNNYQNSAYLICLQPSQMNVACCEVQDLSDFTLAPSEDCTPQASRKSMRAKLLRFLVTLHDIAFSFYGTGNQLSQNNGASSDTVLHVSNGGFILPVIWNPDEILRRRG
jgi:hypothetical protein